MDPNAPKMEPDNEPRAQIATFAVIDLETSNLPEHRNNKVSITELCIYAFDPATLNEYEKKRLEEEADLLLDELASPLPRKLPLPPRVLHKLNLLFQPSMMIDPVAENITGLDNYLLERESKLNENAGYMILNFLEHLPAPVCLIAHNGWKFDYPIIRQTFNKLNIQLPGSMLCLDSLRAFMEIDDMRNAQMVVPTSLKEPEIELEVETELQSEPEIKLELDSELSGGSLKTIDWEALNNTTPKRPTLPRAERAYKRKCLNGFSSEDVPIVKQKPQELHARRQLFRGLNCAQTKRFPPRGRYRLANLFESTFGLPAATAHQAEGDVQMLTKLIQYYGIDFLAFAEEEAIPFANVVPIGGMFSK